MNVNEEKAFKTRGTVPDTKKKSTLNASNCYYPMLNYTEKTLTGKNDKLFLALQGNFDPSKYKRLQMGLTENLPSFSNYLYNSPEEN